MLFIGLGFLAASLYEFGVQDDGTIAGLFLAVAILTGLPGGNCNAV